MDAVVVIRDGVPVVTEMRDVRDGDDVVTRPGKVLCVGINYKKHIEETGPHCVVLP